jgi:hypothetical protein
MKTTIKVSASFPMSITSDPSCAPVLKEVKTLGRSSTFIETVAPPEYSITLVDGEDTIYELPVTELVFKDFLNKFLEHYGYRERGKGINGINR